MLADPGLQDPRLVRNYFHDYKRLTEQLHYVEAGPVLALKHFGSDDLARHIFRCQRELAAKAGIDPSVAGLRHSTFYARMLETAHLERVITLRYGSARRYPGWVGDMKTAIARAMRSKTSQVDKWRKAISARRNGRAERIPTFRPRS